MMQLEIGGRRHPVAAGETIIGSGPGCAVVLEGDEVRPRHAIVHGTSRGAAAIRTAAPDAEVLINGVRLGPDPTPVLHGDKIQIGGHELLAVDPQRVGSTQLFDASAFDVAMPKAAQSAPAAGAASGGRLVCLTDGREYTIGGGVVLGRDASADVVVDGQEVSRRHAEIRPGPDGYVLHDFSVNGTYVNGIRIDKAHPLAKGDMIRVGNDEFRFHADPGAPPGAAFQLADTMFDVPVAELGNSAPVESEPPAAPAAPPLASFFVRSGAIKGRRLPVRAPVVNIGRADYNDVVIGDPSVSTAHAKLQRRDGIWILTDSGSTNGTYVDGEPVTEETPLLAGATVKFGDVAALFEPHDERVEAHPAPGTQVMEQIDIPAAPAPTVEPEPAPAPRPRPRRPLNVTPPRHRGLPGWAVAVLCAAAAAAAGVAAAFLFLR